MLTIILWILAFTTFISVLGWVLGGGFKFFLVTWGVLFLIAIIVVGSWGITTFAKWLINRSIVPKFGLKPISFWKTYVILMIIKFLDFCVFGGIIAFLVGERGMNKRLLAL